MDRIRRSWGEEARNLCTVCRDLASGSPCPRCGRPLCPRHAVGADERCIYCEEQYYQRRRRVTQVLLLLFVAAVVGLVVVARGGLVRALIFAGAAAPLLGLGSLVALRLHRRSFLRRRY